MSVQIDLNDLDDPQDAVHRIVQALVGEGVVRLQLAEADWAAALATSDRATEAFLSLSETAPAALMFFDDAAAGDLVELPGHRVCRLLRGGIGPSRIQIPIDQVDSKLFRELPSTTRQLVSRDHLLSLAPPSGSVTSRILRLTPGPLLVCPAESTSEGENVYDVWLSDSYEGPPPPLSVFDVDGERFRLSEPGSLTPADVSRMMAERILFVCTGNTCRSPMAEALFRSLLAGRLGCALEELPSRGFEIASAGLAAMAGAPASIESVQVCEEGGVDLSRHASQPLTLALLEQFDRVYTMTAGHREAIVSQYPEMAARIEMLSPSGQDVSDPIGCGRAAYEKCYAEITECLSILVDELTNS